MSATLNGVVTLDKTLIVQGVNANVSALDFSINFSDLASGFFSGKAAAKSISIGGSSYHFFLLMSDGSVRGVGTNNNGQLGVQDKTAKSSTVQVIGISTVTNVGIGRNHSMFILKDGTVRSVGSNQYGQLGVGGTTSTYSTVVQVLGITNAVKTASGECHTVFMLANGTVYATGLGTSGQLGDGAFLTRSTIVQMLGITSAIQVAAGDYHSAVLSSDGKVFCTGRGSLGQLGDQAKISRSTIVQMVGVTSAIQIACGGEFTLVLMADGTVYGTGYNSTGTLGDQTKTDKSTIVQMIGVTSAIQVGGGQSHSIVLMSDNSVYATGLNDVGQMGVGGTTSTYSTIVQVLGVSTGIQISSTNTNSYILLKDGTIRGTGSNANGNLGDGTNVNRSTVVAMVGYTDTYHYANKVNLGPIASPTNQLELSSDQARKLTTSTWTTGSDMRIKEDIETANVSRCVEIVNNLDLKYFKWTIDGLDDTHSLGWIAQELEQFFPKSVETSECYGISDFKSVNTDQMIKVMWGALKKLRADLKARNSV